MKSQPIAFYDGKRLKKSMPMVLKRGPLIGVDNGFMDFYTLTS
jgi:hypothetical protein